MKKKSQKQIDRELVFKRQTPIQEAAAMTVKDAVRRVFDNLSTQEDLLFVAEKINEFKNSDLMAVMIAAVEYVVNNELDNEKTGVSADERLGVQKGARRVLTSILGLERTGMVINNQMERQKEQEKLEKLEDGEDLNPMSVKTRGQQGI